MYAMMIEEAVQDAAIIIGTLVIHSMLVVILFDFDSTNTFLAKTFVDRVGMTVEDLGYDLDVLTPIGAITPLECVRGMSSWLSSGASFR